jgi:hypothetical protein
MLPIPIFIWDDSMNAKMNDESDNFIGANGGHSYNNMDKVRKNSQIAPDPSTTPQSKQ